MNATQAIASAKLNDRLANASDSLLIGLLGAIDATLDAAPQDDRPAHILVRARLIAEAERRWPAADEAVAAAFDAEDAAIQRGEDGPPVDYIAVLLANIPS